ncbi:MAG: NAD(+)/NADH kinase [Anaerolineales bacterium]|nr:NAD(+)/NADH kinase [Anaerolineales bacterium]MCB8935177.1 NAD(+)/NADH kinase [Promineifilum sp.]
MKPPFRNIHIIINPASGSDEPILNPINDVLGQFELKWDAHITHQSGDGTRLTAEALAAGADLIVSYGGDGTLMEVVNGLVGHDVPLAVLPGGTGNGVALAMGIPQDLRQALMLIGNDGPDGDLARRRKLDVVRCNDRYFIQRAFVGLSEEYIPDRQMKDSVGFLAYPISALRFISDQPSIRYRIAIDDFVFEDDGILCLVNNVGYSNSDRLRDIAERVFLEVQVHEGKDVETVDGTVLDKITPDDGLLDVILVTSTQTVLGSILSLPLRNKDSTLAKAHLFQGKRVSISTTSPQTITLDGENGGQTPAEIELIPAAIEIIVPAETPD